MMGFARGIFAFSEISNFKFAISPPLLLASVASPVILSAAKNLSSL